ncbi:MAG: uracil-DNA glycosylase family protein [Thermodesulfobacteriota bacterium]
MPVKDKQKEMEALRAAITRACLGAPALRGAVPVFGSGPVPCTVMIVGEAPGRDETRLGVPFVGKAGRYLVSVLMDVFGEGREGFYITNVVKVWPTIETKRRKTRKPTAEEEGLFRPFLEEEISIVAPRAIIAVGKTAFAALAPGREFTPGAWVEPDGVPIMPVYHPSYLLRRQKSLEEATERFKTALREVKKKAR